MTFQFMGQCSNQLSHTSQGLLENLNVKYAFFKRYYIYFNVKIFSFSFAKFCEEIVQIIQIANNVV